MAKAEDNVPETLNLISSCPGETKQVYSIEERDVPVSFASRKNTENCIELHYSNRTILYLVLAFRTLGYLRRHGHKEISQSVTPIGNYFFGHGTLFVMMRIATELGLHDMQQILCAFLDRKMKEHVANRPLLLHEVFKDQISYYSTM